GRVPSIKELSVELAVNNRTVIKAYEYMQMKEIIYVKRGLGYFVSPDARDIIVEERRDEFFHDTLDDVFREMDILGISIDDVVKRYRDHITS
ncbi:GntR family transcriptional regulator, partial [uncultured Muribaculum sp.]